MTVPLSSASVLLHPWQFPELEEPRTLAPMPSSPEAGPSGDANTVGEHTRPNDDHDRIGQIVEEQISNGYVDGLQRGLTEGRERGYAEGIDAGMKAAEEALAAQSQRLAAIVSQLSAPISALETLVEEAVTALALEVARCVIGSETSRSRDYLVRLIREAIAKIPIEMGDLRVVLNPADLELIRALAPEIENGSATLVGDMSVEAGGCLVVADGQSAPVKDMRWRPRAGEGLSQVDLTLASRWRNVMLTLFEGEDK